MESSLSIEEVAERTGLSAHTLRYYERIGLIAPIRRGPGGHRRYAASDIAWIEFLLRLRATNMPVGKMQTFAELRAAGDSTVPDRRRMLEEHLSDVASRIEALRRSARVLQKKIAHYRQLEGTLASDSTSDGEQKDEQSGSL